MIVICREMAAVQRSKEVSTQKASRYKKEVHFLKNADRKEHVSAPKIDKQLEGVLTSCRRQKKGQSQDMKGNRLREENSLAGDLRGSNKSEHGKKATQRMALTFWRPQREGQVRTWKESD